jgi:hypothetical protein
MSPTAALPGSPMLSLRSCCPPAAMSTCRTPRLKQTCLRGGGVWSQWSAVGSCKRPSRTARSTWLPSWSSTQTPSPSMPHYLWQSGPAIWSWCTCCSAGAPMRPRPKTPRMLSARCVSWAATPSWSDSSCSRKGDRRRAGSPWPWLMPPGRGVSRLS